jgi:formate/nitrite transporter
VGLVVRGNLIGSLALAWLVAQSGVLGSEPQRGFVESAAATKMGLAFWPAVARGILCNWLVCLALWCSMRTANEGARLAVIFWCLFAFIGAGFEHSVANMTLLAIALFQPHAEAVSWLGYAQNLVPVTVGNVIGGAFFVGGLYWFAARGIGFAARPVVNSATHPGSVPTVRSRRARPLRASGGPAAGGPVPRSRDKRRRSGLVAE